MKRLLFISLFAATPIATHAAPFNGGGTPAASAADDFWSQLKNYGQGIDSEVDGKVAGKNAHGSTATTTSPAPGNSSGTSVRLTVYTRRANELRDFRLKNPSHAAAAEARRLEALNLLYAAVYGDTALSARRESTVNETRHDRSLPSAERFEVASLADHLGVDQKHGRAPAVQSLEREAVARALVKEFPDVPEAYDALLRLAEDSDDDQSVRIARDLLEMPIAQDRKDRAQTIIDRAKLIGKPLTSAGLGLAGNPLPRLSANRIALLYTWSASNELSLYVAKSVEASAPKGATVIGVNLDTNTSEAKTAAKTRGLTAAQVYDSAGAASTLSKTLKLTQAPEVYATNATGLITTVTAQVHLQEAIDTASK